MENYVLIADDDKDLIEGLSWYLEAEGFDVVTAVDGVSALEKFREHHPGVVILDIMMPGMDGVEVCGAIRRESDAYIMMLSARDGELDKVRALSIGADDYVVKPFHATEVVARIKAFLRRYQGKSQESDVYRWKGLLVSVSERRATVDGEAVDLTSMEFDLLAAMMAKPKSVFPREQLIKVIWGDDFYGELRLVDNHVYRLRDKLTNAGLENCPIVTIRGVGYAFRPET